MTVAWCVGGTLSIVDVADILVRVGMFHDFPCLGWAAFPLRMPLRPKRDIKMAPHKYVVMQ